MSYIWEWAQENWGGVKILHAFFGWKAAKDKAY